MIIIREAEPADVSALQDLYPKVFPDENLLPLVLELLNERKTVLFLVALSKKALVGHIAFTKCQVSAGDETVALLGPLAVSPSHQRTGIGSLLVNTGLQKLKNDKVIQALVLGDPKYYHRFGFQKESSVIPPYPIPQEWKEAWQSIKIHDCKTPLNGKLMVPKAWQKSKLWSS